MKKILLPIFLLLVAGTTLFAQTTVTLTFTGYDQNNAHVRLDNVTIQNVTRGWTDAIFFPDTVYTLTVGTGIVENTAENEMQVMPNPFDGLTDINLMVTVPGPLTMGITDVNGRAVVEMQNYGTMSLGSHRFRISLRSAGTYILTVRQNGKNSSVKMVNTGHAADDRIYSVENEVGTAQVQLRSTTSHDFVPGDEMCYTGYTQHNGSLTPSTPVTQLQGGSEVIPLVFNLEYAELPIVATVMASDITANSAVSGGNVFSDGGASVTARGVCWSVEPAPTIAENHTNDGTGTGAFTSNLTNLVENTTYYVRAYATNSAGTAYGQEVTFTTVEPHVNIVGDTAVIFGQSATLTAFGTSVGCYSYVWSTGDTTATIVVIPSRTTSYTVTSTCNESRYTVSASHTVVVYPILPTVTTSAVSSITSTTAFCGGDVTSDGGADITARGVCWSTISGPTVSGSHTTNGIGTGVFTSTLTGLVPNTTYYVRAYAINSAGTAYGEEVTFITTGPSSFDCGTSQLFDYDGNTYTTVLIGTQCWMAENLRTTHFSDGTPIPEGTTSSASVSYRYIPNNDAIYVPTYGYLYNQAAVIRGSVGGSQTNPSGVQGVCPTGWHVPSRAEWKQLFDTVKSKPQYWCDNSSYNIGKALSYTSGWMNSTYSCAIGNNQVSNNVTGFGVKPSGCAFYDSYDFYGLGRFAMFWCSDVYSESGIYIDFEYSSTHPWDEVAASYMGMSVRCLQDRLPVVSTAQVGSVTFITAVCGGEVTNSGASAIIDRGVCWSTSQNPTVADNVTHDGTGTGVFSSDITGLLEGTVYYVRAYATNAFGTSYGAEYRFVTRAMPPTGDNIPCPGVPTVTDVDGNVYNTVKIGRQCWMKENLKTTRYADATSILLGTGTSSTTAYRYNPGNNSTNVSTYGYLYNWPAVVRGVTGSNDLPSCLQGVCPYGWHVPSELEWTELTDYVSSQPYYRCDGYPEAIARAMASSYGWETTSGECAVGSDTSTNNATGFSAIPAGAYGQTSYYTGFGRGACFWTATANNGYGSDYAYRRHLYSDESIFVSSSHYEYDNGLGRCSDAYSVRCVRDTVYLPTVTTEAVSDSSTNAAVCNGNVLYSGGSSVIYKGFCWDTVPNPTLSNSNYSSVSTNSNLGVTNVPSVSATPDNLGQETGFLASYDFVPGQENRLSNRYVNNEDYQNSIQTRSSNTSVSTGLGSFTYTITGLRPGTTYYLRAYATNAVGTAYGNEVTFHTLYDMPGVTTSAIHSVTDSTAVVGGVVTHDGGDPMVVRGICWNNAGSPTLEDQHIEYGNGMGEYSVTMTNLRDSVVYYVRAYATNQMGTRYGNVKMFRTHVPIPDGDAQPCPGTPTVTDVDGNVYNTVKIGGQCWMKENLRTTRYTNGPAIAMGSTFNDTIPYRYAPNDDMNNVATYGYLYNWPAVMNSGSNHDICPDGWHVPSLEEWSKLGNYVSNNLGYCYNYVDAKPLKALASVYGWDSSSEEGSPGFDTLANNATGFNALPAGIKINNNGSSFGHAASFWCTAQVIFGDDDTGAGAVILYENSSYNQIPMYVPNKFSGCSVRCLKTLPPQVTTVSVQDVDNHKALGIGNISTDGGSPITACGFCWSVSPNPTIADNHTVDSLIRGSFKSVLTNLVDSMTYYVRAYATNALGTEYGDEQLLTYYHFNCGTTVLMDTDANVYSTVQIGDQCWMRENLRTTRYANGTNIGLGTSSSTTTPYRYYPSNNSNNVREYGYLYNWPAVMGNAVSSNSTPSGVQGICPDGWHVPSDEEWTQLSNYVSLQGYYCGSSTGNIAKALASTTGWSSSTNYCAVGRAQSENNVTGFTAVPAGYYTGNYLEFGKYVGFWSATADNNNTSATYVLGRRLAYNSADFAGTSSVKNNGYSVRCVRNLAIPNAVITNPATGITTSSAILHGTVSNPNNETIIAQGFEWRADSSDVWQSVNVLGNTDFSYNLTELTENTEYVYRAFAVFAISGTKYGEQVSFTTQTIPVVPAGEYFTGFEVDEGFSSSIFYNNSSIRYFGDDDRQWGTFYGTVSTYDPLVGNQSMQLRWYTTYPDNLGYTFTNFQIRNLSHVTFQAKSTGDLNVNVSHSVDGGVTFSEGQTFVLSQIAQEFDYVVDTIGSSNQVQLKFSLVLPDTTLPTSTSGLIIDNVVTYAHEGVVVTTSAATDITQTSATLHGTVSNLGNETIIAQGFECLSPEDSLANIIQIPVSGTVMSYNLTGLWANTSYFYRAFVTTSSGTVYGEEVEFTTLAETMLPQVTTGVVQSVDTHSAIVENNVVSDGGATITNRGVCWSTLPNPTIVDSHTEDGVGAGYFTSTISGLEPNTTYYIRAYASNNVGTTYGNQNSFMTLPNENYLLNENFGNDSIPTIPTGWTIIDRDGDGYGWGHSSSFITSFNTSFVGRDSSGCYMSFSYLNNIGELTPDNWLITPAIVLPNNISAVLSFWRSSHPNFPEHYGVYITTSSNYTNLDNYTLLWEETISSRDWAKVMIPLRDYAGQTVHIAFRHFNCADQYYLSLDDVIIFRE